MLMMLAAEFNRFVVLKRGNLHARRVSSTATTSVSPNQDKWLARPVVERVVKFVGYCKTDSRYYFHFNTRERRVCPRESKCKLAAV
jgi:hypothetical protein